MYIITPNLLAFLKGKRWVQDLGVKCWLELATNVLESNDKQLETCTPWFNPQFAYQIHLALKLLNGFIVLQYY
jgi:hypothetical protein